MQQSLFAFLKMTADQIHEDVIVEMVFPKELSSSTGKPRIKRGAGVILVRPRGDNKPNLVLYTNSHAELTPRECRLIEHSLTDAIGGWFRGVPKANGVNKEVRGRL